MFYHIVNVWFHYRYNGRSSEPTTTTPGTIRLCESEYHDVSTIVRVKQSETCGQIHKITTATDLYISILSYKLGGRISSKIGQEMDCRTPKNNASRQSTTFCCFCTRTVHRCYNNKKERTTIWYCGQYFCYYLWSSFCLSL